MKSLLKFSTIVLLLLVLIGLVLLTVIGEKYLSDKGADVTFKNDSGQIIESVNITVSRQNCGAKKIGVGGSLSCQFKNLSDSDYKVSVTMVGGTVHNANLGYVSRGINFNDVITIDQSGELTLVQKTGT